MTATYKTSSQLEPLSRAVRTVDRWGLVAGVTGVLGNVLLAVLLTTPADGPYAWTGPANDVIGVVSTLAIIPVVAGLLTVCGNRPGLGAISAPRTKGCMVKNTEEWPTCLDPILALA